MYRHTTYSGNVFITPPSSVASPQPQRFLDNYSHLSGSAFSISSADGSSKSTLIGRGLICGSLIACSNVAICRVPPTNSSFFSWFVDPSLMSRLRFAPSKQKSHCWALFVLRPLQLHSLTLLLRFSMHAPPVWAPPWATFEHTWYILAALFMLCPMSHTNWLCILIQIDFVSLYPVAACRVEFINDLKQMCPCYNQEQDG